MRFALLSIFLLPACLNPQTVDDTADTSDTNVGAGATIQQIQRGDFTEDETVTLRGVVVTSAATVKNDGFFVQDAGGGEYSGIYVFLQAGLDTLYLEPGLTINVTGSVTEFYDWTELSVTSETAIEVTGSAEVTVDVVDPEAVVSWEAWESCLISVGASTVAEGLNNFNEALLDNGLKIDDLLWVFDVEAGSSFSNVTGALGYSYEEWKLFPRFEADLEGYTPPTIETTTIQDIQNETVTGTVIVEDVIVTSPMTSKEGVDNGFYVQAAGGGARSGVYVYRRDGFGTYSPEIGDVVTIKGEVTEYYEATQIVVKDIEDLTDNQSTAELTATNVDPASVSDWEDWESCLVNIGAVTATSDVDDYGEVQTNVGLNIDNQFYDFPSSNGQAWSEVSGVLGYSFSAFKIWPRFAADMVD